MVSKAVVFLVFVVAVAMAAEQSIQEKWEGFKTEHNRNYESPEEEARRFQIFETNVKKIIEHNKKYEAGEVTFTMAINKFADRTPEEIKKGHLGALKPDKKVATAV